MGESTATWIEFYELEDGAADPGYARDAHVSHGLGAYPTDQAGWRSSSTIRWKSFDLAAYP